MANSVQRVLGQSQGHRNKHTETNGVGVNNYITNRVVIFERLVACVLSCYYHQYTNTSHMVTFHAYNLIAQTKTKTHPSPPLCSFHPFPRLTLPGCHNDWLSMLQPEGMMPSHHCLSVRLAYWLTAFHLSVWSQSVGMSFQSAFFFSVWLICQSHPPHLSV